MADLNEKLFGNFVDGTLADAVEEFAKDFDHDAVGQSVLLEAASRVRIGAELYEALEAIASHTDPDAEEENYRADDREGCLDTVFAFARAALVKARGETPCTLNLEGERG